MKLDWLIQTLLARPLWTAAGALIVYVLVAYRDDLGLAAIVRERARWLLLIGGGFLLGYLYGPRVPEVAELLPLVG